MEDECVRRRRDRHRVDATRIGLPDDRSRVPLTRPIRPPRLRGRPRLQQLRPPGHGDRDAGGHRRRRSTRRSTPASRSSTRPTSTAASTGSARRSRRIAARSARRGRARDEVRPRDLPSRAARLGRTRLAVVHPPGRRGSLRRLQTDWIDLYQLHTPDPETPIDETIAALDELVRARARSATIGHSNLSGWQIAEAELAARELGASAVRLGAERVQPARARRRGARCCRRSQHVRPRLPALLPAAQRPADRQVHARSGPADTPHHAPAPARRRRTRRGTCSSATSDSATSAASRCSRRRSAGCSRSRPRERDRGRDQRPSRSVRTPRPAARGGPTQARPPRSRSCSRVADPSSTGTASDGSSSIRDRSRSADAAGGTLSA